MNAIADTFCMTRFAVESPGAAPLPTGASARGTVSAEIQAELVATLYAERWALSAGGGTLAAAACVGWMLTRQPWFLVWSIAVIVVTAGRIANGNAFGRQRAQDRNIRLWRRRFMIGTGALGMLLGVAAGVMLEPVEPTLRLLIVSVHLFVVMGAVTRNASCPAAAKGMVFFGFTPLIVAGALSGDGGKIIYAMFALVEMLGSLATIRYLYHQKLALLQANEANRILAGEAQLANVNLAAANSQLEEAATTDALTGIGNRRRFDRVLADELRRAQRDGSLLSLLMLDIDNFKGFNDLYGHQAGDDCLKQVVTAMSSALRRPSDEVARYGGEEFSAILPATNAAAAAALAEGIRLGIESLAIANAPSSRGVVTVSIGAVTVAACAADAPADVIRAADEALYAAKAAGRNCVRIAAASHRAVRAASPFLPSGTAAATAGSHLGQPKKSNCYE